MSLCLLCSHTVDQTRTALPYCTDCMGKLPGSFIAIETTPPPPSLEHSDAEFTFNESDITYGQHLLIPALARVLADEMEYTAFDHTQHFSRIPVLNDDFPALQEGMFFLQDLLTLLDEASEDMETGENFTQPCTHTNDECSLTLYKTEAVTDPVEGQNYIYIEGLPYQKVDDESEGVTHLTFQHVLDGTHLQGICTRYALTPGQWDTLYKALDILISYVNLSDFPTYQIPSV